MTILSSILGITIYKSNGGPSHVKDVVYVLNARGGIYFGKKWTGYQKILLTFLKALVWFILPTVGQLLVLQIVEKTI